ncbi:MAG: hypothetical protein JWQ90_3891 [Hydrocarboniphaga sp.]|uniref:DUF4286 family protein n=1 Tax=Hydrocarboniphaga sp. TaxID=2033016 RepID=UPI0026304558|nr:DUF4286 family protein [Hydrocarboniphaga sp.]MDB5971441.1 hypothetical protein [Hydrocarboniphaga sp.]
MASYRLLVLSNPVEGRDAEYNEWYSRQHLQDVVRIPGFVGAQRFQLVEPVLMAENFPWRYVAIYEIETDDLAVALGELSARTGTTAVPMSEAIDTVNIVAVPMAPITERLISPR